MDQGNKSGIYRIVNTVSNRTYIGSSVRIRQRLRDHRRELIRGVHKNTHLQAAWNKYGERSFNFETLIICEKDALEIKEQRFIDAYLDHQVPLYNKMASKRSPLWTLYKPSDEAKAKIRASVIGRPLSPEHRANVSNALKGKPHTPEWNAKVGKFHKGRKRSPETCARISIANKGRLVSDETRAKMRASHIGKKLSPEHLEKVIANILKVNAAKKGIPLSGEYKKKLSLSHMGRSCSPITRAKIGLSNKIAHISKLLALQGQAFTVSIDTRG